MPSYVVGFIAISLSLLMLVVGRARNGVPRPFLSSYLAVVLYAVTAEGIFVFGLVWIIFRF